MIKDKKTIAGSSARGENKPVVMRRFVSCCAECPFYEYQDEMMSSDCRAAENGLFFGSYKQAEKIITKGVHKDCPLKKNKLIIALSNGA